MDLKRSISREGHVWSAKHRWTNIKPRERMLSWIKDDVPLLHSPMLKSNTSPPNKPWARALFLRVAHLDPARQGPKHILTAWVSWLLPWRPRQIRHDECWLFALWQTHPFTVGWCLQEVQRHATLTLRNRGREKRRWGQPKGKKESAKSRNERQRSVCVENNAHTGGMYDWEWQKSPFSPLER